MEATAKWVLPNPKQLNEDTLSHSGGRRGRAGRGGRGSGQRASRGSRDEEDRRRCRSFVGEGDEESRLLHYGSVASAADPSTPPLAALSLLWVRLGAVPVPVVATKLLSPSSSSASGRDSTSAKGWNRNTSWGTDVHRSPSPPPPPPNASLGCVAWLKSGKRRVHQPGDALHRREQTRTEKRTPIGEETT
uniref:Uncharacterized protein n=1 Tax=Oryza rufipogon TaxID=4529 RepID=A0A0E0QM38_ORYRU